MNVYLIQVKKLGNLSLQEFVQRIQQIQLLKGIETKKPFISERLFCYLWSHMGSNHGPPDYETHYVTFQQLSFSFISLVIISLRKTTFSFACKCKHISDKLLPICCSKVYKYSNICKSVIGVIGVISQYKITMVFINYL